MTLRPWIALMLFALPLLILAAGCVKNPSASAPISPPALPAPTASAAVISSDFVGNAVCRTCHAEEHKLHGASRHARTLRAATRKELGSLMPPSGPVPETEMVFREREGALRMTMASDADREIAVDLAFGSGKTGLTFVAFLGEDQAMELHKSWFPSLHTWYQTPGQERLKPTDVGRVSSRQMSQKCLSCHTVTVSEAAIKPEPRFFGVGCESCHGAGGAHAAAMQTGKQGDIAIERLGKLDATKLNTLCGRCHRGIENVNLQTDQAQMTNRFQAYGLMKSRCFLESGNSLSCITCHNPHKDASTDTKTYEAVCKSCHASGGSSASGAAVKSCPVNPGSGCIGCHMPKRPVFSQANPPTQMADHYIRAENSLIFGAPETK